MRIQEDVLIDIAGFNGPIITQWADRFHYSFGPNLIVNPKDKERALIIKSPNSILLTSQEGDTLRIVFKEYNHAHLRFENKEVRVYPVIGVMFPVGHWVNLDNPKEIYLGCQLDFSNK